MFDLIRQILGKLLWSWTKKCPDVCSSTLPCSRIPALDCAERRHTQAPHSHCFKDPLLAHSPSLMKSSHCFMSSHLNFSEAVDLFSWNTLLTLRHWRPAYWHTLLIFCRRYKLSRRKRHWRHVHQGPVAMNGNRPSQMWNSSWYVCRIKIKAALRIYFNCLMTANNGPLERFQLT
jgi:hypothetical protein